MQFWRQTYANSVDMNEASEQLPSGERSPEQRVLARERVGQLWKAVDRLSNRQRTVFLLRYAEEREFWEIAHTTGLQESSVKAHLSRAVAKVRLQLATRQ
jgi:RNA polymerase sigma-70 factor (ECF subfamily)